MNSHVTQQFYSCIYTTPVPAYAHAHAQSSPWQGYVHTKTCTRMFAILCLFSLLFVIVSVFVCAHEYMCPRRPQTLYPSGGISLLTWVLGTEQGTSERAACTPDLTAIFQNPLKHHNCFDSLPQHTHTHTVYLLDLLSGGVRALTGMREPQYIMWRSEENIQKSVFSFNPRIELRSSGLHDKHFDFLTKILIQLKSKSDGEWINTMWYMHTCNRISFGHKSKVFAYATIDKYPK